MNYDRTLYFMLDHGWLLIVLAIIIGSVWIAEQPPPTEEQPNFEPTENEMDKYYESLARASMAFSDKIAQKVCLQRFDLNGEVTGGNIYDTEVRFMCAEVTKEQACCDDNSKPYFPVDWENPKYYCRWTDEDLDVNQVNCVKAEDKI